MNPFPSRRLILSGLAGMAGLATLAGTVPTAKAADEPISVVATTGMIADAVRVVGGDAVTVKGLMGPGVDPHAFRQTRSDIAAMLKADLVLWHGLYLEAQMEDFLLDLGTRKPVVAVAERIAPEKLRANEDYDGKFDPHVWMNPALWSEVVLAVRDALIGVRPGAADAFEARTSAYLAELSELAAYAEATLASVPENSRVLISAHDAFGYFGDAYGFDVLGIQGISTESEAGLNRIEALVDLIVTRDVGAVFIESSVSDRNIRALIEGAAARGHTVAIGGELFSDAMGADGTYEGSFIGMIDHNATTVTRALGGTAPERGMNGRLFAGS